MFLNQYRVSLLLLAILLSACDKPVDSTSVSNSELQANIRVTKIFSDTATVTTSLKAITPSGTEDVVLTGSERLLVSIDAGLDELFTQDAGGLFENTSNISSALFELKSRQDDDRLFEFFSYNHNPEYFTILKSITDDSKFFISMIRQTDVNIIDSQISLPPPFQISSPASGETISRSQPILITWDNIATNNMELHIEGTCDAIDTNSDNGTVSDTFSIGTDFGFSSILINATVLTLPTRFENSRCHLNLHLRRIQSGIIVSSFGSGGVAEGIQQRTISIVSVP